MSSPRHDPQGSEQMPIEFEIDEAISADKSDDKLVRIHPRQHLLKRWAHHCAFRIAVFRSKKSRRLPCGTCSARLNTASSTAPATSTRRAARSLQSESCSSPAGHTACPRQRLQSSALDMDMVRLICEFHTSGVVCQLTACDAHSTEVDDERLLQEPV